MCREWKREAHQLAGLCETPRQSTSIDDVGPKWTLFKVEYEARVAISSQRCQHLGYRDSNFEVASSISF